MSSQGVKLLMNGWVIIGTKIYRLKGQYNLYTVIYDYYRDGNVAFQAFQSGNVDFMRETDAARWQSEYNFPAIIKGDVTKVALQHKRPEWVHGFATPDSQP